MWIDQNFYRCLPVITFYSSSTFDRELRSDPRCAVKCIHQCIHWQEKLFPDPVRITSIPSLLFSRQPPGTWEPDRKCVTGLENRVEMNTGIHEGITAPSWFIHSTHFLVSYWHMHFLCINITAIKQEGVEYEFQIDWNNQQCITWKDELAPFGIVENGVKACILSSAPQIFPNIVMCQFAPSSQLTPTKSWGWRLARSSSVTRETTRSFLNCCSCYVTGQMCTFVGKALSVLLPRHELMDTHDWLASLLHLSIRVTPFLPPREYNRFWCLGLPAMDGFGIQTQDFQKTVWTIFSCITQV